MRLDGAVGEAGCGGRSVSGIMKPLGVVASDCGSSPVHGRNWWEEERWVEKTHTHTEKVREVKEIFSMTCGPIATMD